MSKSPEHEKEPGPTHAGGRSRVLFIVVFSIRMNAISQCHDILTFMTCFDWILQRVEPERTLTDAQRDEFEDMLRALTLERSQIKEAMGFSLDNADAAGEVVLLLC